MEVDVRGGLISKSDRGELRTTVDKVTRQRNEPPPAEPVVSGSPLKGGKESSSFVPVPESYDTVGQLKPIESRAACMAVFLVAGRRRERDRERERVRVDAGTAEPYEFSPAEPVV